MLLFLHGGFMRTGKILCRIGRHRWVVDTWIPVTGGRAIVRYRCCRCGAIKNAWKSWPSATRSIIR